MKTKNFGKLFVGILLFIFFVGCSNPYLKQRHIAEVQKKKIGGTFLIHKNPKVGDYAVYRVVNITKEKSNGEELEYHIITHEKYEINQVNEYEIIIRKSYLSKQVKFFKNGEETDYEFGRVTIGNRLNSVDYYKINSAGQIMGVRNFNIEYGTYVQYGVAEEGKNGFIKYGPEQKSKDITIGIGKFQVKSVSAKYPISDYETWNSEGSRGLTKTNGEFNTVVYCNEKVKFRKIFSESSSNYEQVSAWEYLVAGYWQQDAIYVSSESVITEELIEQG